MLLVLLFSKAALFFRVLFFFFGCAGDGAPVCLIATATSGTEVLAYAPLFGSEAPALNAAARAALLRFARLLMLRKLAPPRVAVDRLRSTNMRRRRRTNPMPAPTGAPTKTAVLSSESGGAGGSA